MWPRLRPPRRPAAVARAAWLLVVVLAQGLVGFVQYFTGLPVRSSGAMLGAVLITAFTARLLWSVRGPASELPLTTPEPPPPPADRRRPPGVRRRTTRPPATVAAPQAVSDAVGSRRQGVPSSRQPSLGRQGTTALATGRSTAGAVVRQSGRARRSGECAHSNRTSTTIATDSSARYEIETWNSCIGRVVLIALGSRREQLVRLEQEPGRRGPRPTTV